MSHKPNHYNISIKLATRVVCAAMMVTALSGCLGGEHDVFHNASSHTYSASDEELRHILSLVDSREPDKITEAIEIGETLDKESSLRLFVLAHAAPESFLAPQASWVGRKLRVDWAAWPTGIYPYSATSEYGRCGNDTDLVARYSNVNFSDISQLYLTTNNAVTYLVAAIHGFALTEWEANTTTKRVSICAGLSILAGLPVVQNQLASMTLNVSR